MTALTADTIVYAPGTLVPFDPAPVLETLSEAFTGPGNGQKYLQLERIDWSITTSLDRGKSENLYIPSWEDTLAALQEAGYSARYIVQCIYDDPDASIFDPDADTEANEQVYNQINSLRRRTVREVHDVNEHAVNVPVIVHLVELSPLTGHSWKNHPTYGIGLEDHYPDWFITINRDTDTVSIWAEGQEVASERVSGAGKIGPHPTKRAK
ncbi:MAG: hypothetical protein Q3979_05420 [Actinomycetaceae bacterium]|nr:hypothetical protein [Actinomycetaceae bacterium]